MMPILAAALLALTPEACATTDATARFGLDLYRELAAKPGNLFFSPYSIETALAMTSAGAKGKTLEEMLATLHLAKQPHAAMSELGKAISAEGGKDQATLVTANRLFAQAGAPYYPEFLSLTERDYGATLGTLDYHSDPEAARKTINDWVSEQTRHKIEDLMPPGSVTKQTDLVLANAIYFKGEWLEAFEKSATKDEEFKPEGEAPVNRPFLHRKAHYAYAEDQDFQAVRLPYKGGQLAMTIFLPKGSLAAHAKKLTADHLAALTAKLAREEVQLSFPKFRLEHEERLEGVLPKMGMKLAFTPSADFSGMRPLKPDERLFISVVAHKAFVEVDEKGTEAAAATGVGMLKTAALILPRPPKVFRADRPFLFVIEHLPSKALLFLGRVSKP